MPTLAGIRFFSFPRALPNHLKEEVQHENAGSPVAGGRVSSGGPPGSPLGASGTGNGAARLLPAQLEALFRPFPQFPPPVSCEFLLTPYVFSVILFEIITSLSFNSVIPALFNIS